MLTGKFPLQRNRIIAVSGVLGCRFDPWPGNSICHGVGKERSSSKLTRLLAELIFLHMYDRCLVFSLTIGENLLQRSLPHEPLYKPPTTQ